MSMKSLRCAKCGKPVSTPVPEETIVRAYIECPECIEKESQKEGEPMQEKFAMEDILKEVRMGLGLEDTPDNYEDQEHPLFEKISGLFEQTLQGCYFCDPYADMNSPRVEVCPACQIKLVRILTVCGVDTTKVPLLKDIPVPKIRRAVTIAKKAVH